MAKAGSREFSDIRNIAIAGHGNSGKTTLAENMLFAAGATKRLGKVTEHTTVSDYEKDEQQRGISINVSILNAEWKNVFINILDTPGYQDFVGDAVAGMSASDMMILTVCATKGVEVNTRYIWNYAADNNIPCMIVVTKMDGEHANFEKTLEDLQEMAAESGRLRVLSVPRGQGVKFESIVNTFEMNNVPDDMKDIVQSYHDELVEAVVEADDELMNKYLEGEQIEAEVLRTTFQKAIAQRLVIPVTAISCEKGIGVKEILDTICNYAPNPSMSPAKKCFILGTETEEEIKCDANGPLAARVFKIRTDPFVGKIAFIRVYSGRIKAGEPILLSNTEKSVSITQVYRFQGKNQEDIGEAGAGDICALSKIEDLALNITLSKEAKKLQFEKVEFPTPMVSLAVTPKSRADEQKITSSLRKLADEDPTFIVERNMQTKQTIVSGMGNLHLDVMLDRLKSLFGVESTTKIPKIAYLETIRGNAEGHHRHKKQTGGHGQFGEVYIRIEPAPRGEGFQFLNEIVGGVIPRQYIPAVEKGVREKMESGVIAGYQVTDVAVHLYDGKYHDVDSSELSFKLAAGKAFQDAFTKAKPVLLEPIYEMEVMVPSRFMGDINGDLNKRRARIIGMDSRSGMQIIKATVPMSEIQQYSTDLRSVTGGEGAYSIKYSHYDMVPGNVQEDIVARAKREMQEEQE